MKADESPKGATAALLASKGHTVVVLVILLALAINGAISQPMRHWAQTGLESGERVRLYATILATQWLLFWLVRFGIRRAGKTLRQVIDRGSSRLTLGSVCGNRNWSRGALDGGRIGAGVGSLAERGRSSHTNTPAPSKRLRERVVDHGFPQCRLLRSSCTAATC